MNESESPATLRKIDGITPAIVLLFIGSGCSALIYEVVWFHLLRLVVGASAISLGVLLGSFMGGMCIGSILLPRLISRRAHPLKVYAFLELGIGAMGITLPFLLPMIGDLYISQGSAGLGNFMWRGAVCGMALLPPTILMGATLPAVARWVKATPDGISRMGTFYAANIAGAVLGTLLAGFYLLRIYDIMVATYVAFAINVLVAVAALILAARQTFTAPEQPKTTVTGSHAGARRWIVGLAICLSGFTALGAEVIWTRLLSLLLGASVYTFSLILAVFLVGLGIGSSLGARIARVASNPLLAFASCQVLLGGAIGYGAYMIMEIIPYVTFAAATEDMIDDTVFMMFFYDFCRILLAFLPATILWGASFPLALAAASTRSSDPGKLVGGVYAANTVGAIAGALGISLLGFDWGGGSQAVEQLLAWTAVGTAGLMFLSALFLVDRPEPALGDVRAAPVSILGVVAFVLFAIPGVWLATWVPPVKDGLIAEGRYVERWDDGTEFNEVAEGVNASVAVSVTTDGDRSFHVSGKIVASNDPIDMRLQRMLGHLPALLHPDPKRVLIVGCGAGVTAGCFTEYPGIEEIVICEIEPKVAELASKWFSVENRGIIDHPKTRVVFDDARHFLATSNEKFDIITSDPIHPWVRGAAALYSAEYYDLIKDHINPGAIVTQWVPLYQSDEESVKSQVGTFMQAFPAGTLWNSDLDDIGYDIVMMGTMEDTWRIDVSELESRMLWIPAARHAMEEVDLGTGVTMMKTFLGQGPDLLPWLRDTQVNRDRNLRLQYLAGFHLNTFRDADIFGAIKQYRRYPDTLFIATAEEEQELRAAIDR